MARAHKIYFTWKNNNKKENQQEWQLQGKILNETNSLPFLLLQSILRLRDKNKNKPKHKQSNFCLYKSALHLTPQSKFWEELWHHFSLIWFTS